MLDPVHQSFSDYKASPSPDTLNRVVQHLEPTINYSLASLGAHNDPVLRSHAKLFTADAVEKYDPANESGASLPTFVSGQLRQMTRVSRAMRSPLAIPERVQLDSFKLYQAKKRYADEYGREPDMDELADYTSMPIKRLEKIQRYQYSTPSEASGIEVEREGPDHAREALEYIYHDLDHTDRKILEMKTGYGGGPVLDPKSIALQLKLSPTQLSRRSQRITNKLNSIQASLEAIA